MKKGISFCEMIKKYFFLEKRMDEIRIHKKRIFEQIRKIENDIHTSNFYFGNDYISSPSYEVVGSSGSFNTESYIERNVVIRVDKLEEHIEKHKSYISALHIEEQDLLLTKMNFEIFLDCLSKEERDLVYYKYRDGYSNKKTGLKLGYSESGVRYRISEIKSRYNEFQNVI